MPGSQRALVRGHLLLGSEQVVYLAPENLPKHDSEGQYISSSQVGSGVIS